MGMPWCHRVHRAEIICVHATRKFSMCWLTENFRLIDTPSALIKSTHTMLGTASGEISTAHWLFGDTKTISTDLLWFSTWLFSFTHCPIFVYFSSTRLVISCRDDEISVISIVEHWVADQCLWRHRWLDRWLILELCWPKYSSIRYFVTKFRAVWRISEERLYPIVNVVWYTDLLRQANFSRRCDGRCQKPGKSSVHKLWCRGCPEDDWGQYEGGEQGLLWMHLAEWQIYRRSQGPMEETGKMNRYSPYLQCAP